MPRETKKTIIKEFYDSLILPKASSLSQETYSQQSIMKLKKLFCEKLKEMQILAK